MRLNLKETKISVDGGILHIVIDEEGTKHLFEPLNLAVDSKEKVHLELLRELRQLIRTPINLSTVPTDLKIISYIGVEKCGEETGLLLGYDDELWNHWAEKGRTFEDPEKVAAVARCLLSIVETMDEDGLPFAAFYPGDLVTLENGVWGMLDPRVQQLLAPYRAGGDERELYSAPEVIGGSRLTVPAYLYTLGLTLYSLATGEFPFPADNRREAVTAMLREAPLDPRYYQSTIGKGLAEFILKLLQKKPELRPDVATCGAELTNLMQAGELKASPAAAERFQAEASLVQEKAQRKRRLYWRWQRYKWPLAIAVVLMISFFLLGRGGYEEKITPATTPLEVVKVFYDGLGRLDPVQIEEPLADGAGEEFVNMLSVLHVTSKLRQAYEWIDTPFLVLDGLVITEAEASTPEAPAFIAQYRLQLLLGEELVTQERRDQLVVQKKKQEWRITGLVSDILGEERKPADIRKPAGTLDSGTGVR